MVDAEAIEIGVGPAPNVVAADGCAPARRLIADQGSGRMFRPPKQWRSGRQQGIESKRLLQNLGGGVAVACVHVKVTERAPVQFDIRAMRDGLIDIHILALTEAWIEIEIDLV